VAREGRIVSPVTIRDYRDRDLDEVVAIAKDLQDYEAGFYDRLKPSDEIGAWYVEELRKEAEKHKGKLIVAEMDGKVVGYAALFIEVSSEDQREEIPYTCTYVNDLAVAAKQRGQGIGRLLMHECEERARDAGQKWIRLGVHAANREARRFYAELGLEERFLTLEKRLA
jgi:ribosomal protein S18 acetylase RimI-like enzyme